MLMLPAEITHANASACVHMLAKALHDQASAVLADASSLEKFDSSALAVLLECRRAAQTQGKSFAVRGLPQRLRALATLYGVAQLLPETS